jgi:hypothetical protein
MFSRIAIIAFVFVIAGCASHAPLEKDYAEWGARVGDRGTSAAEKLKAQSFSCSRESIRDSDPRDELDVYLCRRPAGHVLISSCFQGANIFTKKDLIERVEVVPPYCVGL